MIETLGTGLVFTNPDPDARPLHAWHATLSSLGEGRWLCSFDLASAVLAPDYASFVSISTDDSRTWTPPTPIVPDGAATVGTHSIRVTALPGGGFVGAGVRWHRDGRYARGVNPVTSGWCPLDLVMTHSPDGLHWSPIEVRDAPLAGPFEVCHRIVILPDGRWLWPMSRWWDWDGDAGDGLHAFALVSRDQGRTWPEVLEEFDDGGIGLVHWEQSLVHQGGGSLLAVGWEYQPSTAITRPLPWARIDGDRVAARGSTGLLAQTSKLLALGDGRVLVAYRRDDEPGLWASIASVEADAWQTHASSPLWQGASSGMRGGSTPGAELADLAFGSPSPALAPDGSVLIAFWCREACVHGIRWVRVRVGP